VVKSISKTSASKKKASKKVTVKKTVPKKTSRKKTLSTKASGKKSPAKKVLSNKKLAKAAVSQKTSVLESPKITDTGDRSYMRVLARSPALLYEHATSVVQKWRETLKSIDGVIGIDVGMKIQGDSAKGTDRSTREFAICITVTDKKSLDSIPENERIQPYYDGVPTDVQVRRFKPAISGIEGGTKIRQTGSAEYGTLGTDVIVASDGRIRYLTCTHVISDALTVTAPISVSDDTGNVIGTVLPNVGIDFVFSELLDCALITPPDPGFARVGIPHGKQNPFSMRAANVEDMAQERVVWKLGAKTGLTFEGYIANIDTAPMPIPYRAGNRIAQGQYLIRSKSGLFADEGDSGSIVCIGNQAIGIIRAVSVETNETLACPFVAAAQRFNFGL
jgi:hypothetical protein